MPSFDTASPQGSIKLLLLGDTGAGKTGALASLIAAGYNVRILDLDRGIEILRDFLTNPDSPYVKAMPGLWPADPKGLLARASYVTITEEFVIRDNRPIPKGSAWQALNKQLNDWTDGDRKFGNIGTWGPQDILVIDSLSRLADDAFAFQLVMNGRAVSGPQQGDWYQAQELVMRILTLLYSEAVKCNVIVNAHIAFIEGDSGLTRGYPQTLGQKLSPKVGQFFNHALMAKTQGQGAGAKRVILTNTANMVELKNTAPLRIKAEYSLSTGLAEYFAVIRGAPQAPKPQANPPGPKGPPGA